MSTTCIPNYPDKHLPTIFIYYEEDMKKQFVGPLVFGGMNLKLDGKFWLKSVKVNAGTIFQVFPDWQLNKR